MNGFMGPLVGGFVGALATAAILLSLGEKSEHREPPQILDGERRHEASMATKREVAELRREMRRLQSERGSAHSSSPEPEADVAMVGAEHKSRTDVQPEEEGGLGVVARDTMKDEAEEELLRQGEDDELTQQFSLSLESTGLPEGASVVEAKCTRSSCSGELVFPDRPSAVNSIDSIAMRASGNCETYVFANTDMLDERGQRMSVFLKNCT